MSDGPPFVSIHMTRGEGHGTMCKCKTCCNAYVAMLYTILGLSQKEICLETGWTQHTVSNAVSRRCQVNYRDTRTKRRAHAVGYDLDQIEREYLDGATTYELGKKYGVNPATISKWMCERGVRMGKGNHQRPENRNGCGHEYVYSDLMKEQRQQSHREGEERFREKLRNATDGKFEYVSNYRTPIRSQAVIRCVECGYTTSHTIHLKGDIRCPVCAERERQYRKHCDEQIREAAREWRLSVPRVCNHCGMPFYSEYEDALYCSDKCKRNAKARRKRASRKARGISVRSQKRRYKQRMRVAPTIETYDRSITLDAVYKKYRGRCCGCGCKTVRSKDYDPRMATLDHVIALANNGTHTWDNVQLLCMKCNTEKRDTGQMRLAI